MDMDADAWLEGEDRERYYDNPRVELPRLYEKYKSKYSGVRSQESE